jgi:hypothetical protein
MIYRNVVFGGFIAKGDQWISVGKPLIAMLIQRFGLEDLVNSIIKTGEGGGGFNV